ncbi:MAG: hypothetical protein H6955_05740 [Chromatiaceae bacterium]|nr:hypothetical protein [Chromatiaceae bacterium]
MKKLGVAVFLVSVLAGCQSSVGVRTEAGGSFVQMQGGTLVLQQALKVPAGKARIYLQDGIAGSGFNSYKPHCALEVRRVDHDGFTIEPDTFVITKVQSSVQEVVQRQPIVVASLVAMGGMDGGGGSNSYYDGYHFWLASDAQPDVRRMSCFGVYAVPADLYPPTIDEIRSALGEIAEIRR